MGCVVQQLTRRPREVASWRRPPRCVWRGAPPAPPLVRCAPLLRCAPRARAPLLLGMARSQSPALRFGMAGGQSPVSLLGMVADQSPALALRVGMARGQSPELLIGMACCQSPGNGLVADQSPVLLAGMAGGQSPRHHHPAHVCCFASARRLAARRCRRCCRRRGCRLGLEPHSAQHAGAGGGKGEKMIARRAQSTLLYLYRTCYVCRVGAAGMLSGESGDAAHRIVVL